MQMPGHKWNPGNGPHHRSITEASKQHALPRSLWQSSERPSHCEVQTQDTHPAELFAVQNEALPLAVGVLVSTTSKPRREVRYRKHKPRYKIPVAWPGNASGAQYVDTRKGKSAPLVSILIGSL